MAKIGKKILQLGSLMLVLWSSSVLAGTLTGELDKSEGTLEDQFVYTLIIQGSFEGEPQLPQVPGLEIEKAGTSQNVSIMNGHFSREVQVQFVLSPQKEGSYTIPPVKLKVEGKIQETLPLELKVLASPQGRSAPGGTGGGAADRTVFIERTFDRSKIYVGESIVAKLRLFNRVKLFGATPEIDYPTSFQQKSLGDQKNFQMTIEGEDYSVTEVRTLLTPTKAGLFAVPAALVEAQVPLTRRQSRSLLDDLMSSRNFETKRFRSTPGQIEVLALPLNGRRSDFTGLVGEFQLDVDLPQRNMKVGDTSTLTLHVHGRGATNGMADPNLDYAGFAKVYRDKPQSQDSVDPEQGILGDRIYKFAIVPSKAGEFSLGTLRLQYFHPATGSYRDLSVDLGKISVESVPSLAKGSVTTPVQALKASSNKEPKPVTQLAEDLVEPHSLGRLMQGSDELTNLSLAIGIGIMTLSLLALPIPYLIRRSQATSGDRMRRKKKTQAYRVYHRQSAEAQRLLKESQAKAAIQLARRCLQTYLADKLVVKGSSLTQKDLAGNLQQKGLDGVTIANMQTVWQKLDQLLYAKDLPETREGHLLLEAMDRVVQEVDRRC